MQLAISHRTVYTYGCPVSFLPHLLYMRPRETPLVRVERFAFNFQPEAQVTWMQDDFDNMPASAQFTVDSACLDIRSDCVVTTADSPPFDFLVRDTARSFPFTYEPLHRFNLSIYLTPPASPIQSAIRNWIDHRYTNQPQDTVGWLFGLSQAFYQCFRYQRRDDPGIQPSLTTIGMGSGSCRDYAVLFVECARTLGLAARFVSGYLFDSTVDGTSSGDMHAWAEVFLPGAGWRGIDPTHGIFCTNAYVPVAQAVVAESVNPIQGSYSSAKLTHALLNVDVRVRCIGG